MCRQFIALHSQFNNSHHVDEDFGGLEFRFMNFAAVIDVKCGSDTGRGKDTNHIVNKNEEMILFFKTSSYRSMKKTLSAWEICDHLKYHIFKRNVQYINMDSVHLVKIKDDCQEAERR